MPTVNGRLRLPSPMNDAELQLGDFDECFTKSYDAVSSASHKVWSQQAE